MALVFSMFAVPIALIAVGVLAFRYFHIRGARVITCPENHRPAGVEVDARHALFGGLRLQNCSRWPEKQGCGQQCLAEIAGAADGCLVRNRLAEWYAGKACVLCGKTFHAIQWAERKPALVDAAGTLVEWTQIPAERLPEVLESHRPVCFDCGVVETFRCINPELVTDRSQFHGPGIGGLLRSTTHHAGRG